MDLLCDHRYDEWPAIKVFILRGQSTCSSGIREIANFTVNYVCQTVAGSYHVGFKDVVKWINVKRIARKVELLYFLIVLFISYKQNQFDEK